MKFGYKDDPIFLLSVEEYLKIQNNILKINAWWWLRSPGNYSDYAASVNNDGSVYFIGNYVNYCSDAVRPALHFLNLNSSNYEFVDKNKIKFANYLWTNILPETDVYICDTYIDRWRFDEESNDYEKSEIRQFLLDWFECRNNPDLNSSYITLTPNSTYVYKSETISDNNKWNNVFNVPISGWGINHSPIYEATQDVLKQISNQSNNKEINDKMSVRKETKTTIIPMTKDYQLDYYKDGKRSSWKTIPKISEIKEYNGNTVKIKFADGSFETAVLSANDEEARLEAALAICYLKKMLDYDNKGEYGTNAFNKLLNIMLKQIEKQKKFDEEKLAKEAEVKRIKENRKAKKEKRLAKYKKKKILNE